jgi:hypothetical protein
MPHAGICAGGRPQGRSLPQMRRFRVPWDEQHAARPMALTATRGRNVSGRQRSVPEPVNRASCSDTQCLRRGASLLCLNPVVLHLGGVGNEDPRHGERAARRTKRRIDYSTDGVRRCPRARDSGIIIASLRRMPVIRLPHTLTRSTLGRRT